MRRHNRKVWSNSTIRHIGIDPRMLNNQLGESARKQDKVKSELGCVPYTDMINMVKKGIYVKSAPSIRTTYGARSTIEDVALILENLPSNLTGILDIYADGTVRLGESNPHTSHGIGNLISTSSYVAANLLKNMEEDGQVTSIPGYVQTRTCLKQPVKVYIRGKHDKKKIISELLEGVYRESDGRRSKEHTESGRHTIYNMLPTAVPAEIIVSPDIKGTSAWYANHKGVSVKDASGTLATTYRVGRQNGKDIHKTRRIIIGESGRIYLTSVYYTGNEKVRDYNDRELYDALFTLRNTSW